MLNQCLGDAPGKVVYCSIKVVVSGLCKGNRNAAPDTRCPNCYRSTLTVFKPYNLIKILRMDISLMKGNTVKIPVGFETDFT